jgi:hypothetical protein
MQRKPDALRGGWSCSFIFTGEGPGYAGCAKSQSDRFTTFRSAAEFYWAAGALCQSAADVVSLLPSGRVNICTGGMTNLKCLWGNVGEHIRLPNARRTRGL